MKNVTRQAVRLAAALVVMHAATQPAHAQTDYRNVVSANPFGLLLELFNGEYERVVSESATAGFGGSYFKNDDDRYLNADVFYRFYPQGEPLNGWAFGAKAGITSISGGEVCDFEQCRQREDASFFGYGFDVNRSWLLGRNNNFYVGVGFGLKRLVGVKDEDDMLQYIPTFRLVNIGFAF